MEITSLINSLALSLLNRDILPLTLTVLIAILLAA